MKGESLNWYKWMHHNQQLTDWPSFLRVLEQCFGPSSYDNHRAELVKLRQYGSVTSINTVLSRCLIGSMA
ncbi:hypothetical protein HKD37_18G050169 [Glycine soja]